MRRLIARLVVLGVFAAGSWIVYQVSDFTSCSGPQAEAWANSTVQRLDMSTSDEDAALAAASVSAFSTLAARAEDRYMAQQAEDAPRCLSTLQEQTSSFLFYEWKAYASAADGDFQTAADYMDQAMAARDAMEREFYRLATQYNWDID
jgi:hypothetical protein